jgi:LacI family transcriptional regulator
MIAETQDDHDRLAVILDHMLSRRVDAIVVAAARAEDKEILESAGRVVPILIAARPLDDTVLPQVIHDDAKGGRLAAEHFYDLGHRLVSQLRGPADVANFSRRAVGFSEFCAAMGMDEVEVPERGHTPSIEEGERLARAVVERGGPLPTAIFAHNDLMAIGALSVLRTAGLRVPGIVSLVGYNDLPMVGQIDPPLTTVLYPSLEVGKMAGEMVRQVLAGERPADHTLDPVLVVRASTRPV